MIIHRKKKWREWSGDGRMVEINQRVKKSFASQQTKTTNACSSRTTRQSVFEVVDLSGIMPFACLLTHSINKR